MIKIDLANSNNIQYYQVYTVYANTNMAGTRIVCPIYTVNLGSARSDLVAYTLVNVNALVVATTSWWLHFIAPVVA